MKTNNLASAAPRRDRLLKEHIHDPYKTTAKLRDATVCDGCGAMFYGGRWQWMVNPPPEGHRQTCQACHRTRDNYPAGVVTLSGDFVLEHRDELIRLLRHHEDKENEAHPLHRIMGIETPEDSIVVTTTDIHLPHRLVEALRRAYHGDTRLDYDEEGYFVRGYWHRDL